MLDQIKERCIYCGADVYYTGSEQLIKCGMCGHTLVVAKFENELARMNAALEEGEAAKRELEAAEKEKQAADDRLFAALSALDEIRGEQDVLGRLLHILSESQNEAGGRLVLLQTLAERLLNAQDDIFEKMNVMQDIASRLQAMEMDGQERQSLMNDFMLWSQQAHEDDLNRLKDLVVSAKDLAAGQQAIAEKITSLRDAAARHQQTLEAFQKQYTSDKMQELQQLFHQAENFRHDWRFEQAEDYYRKVLTKVGRDAEVIWRLLLCHYCVTYQQDDEGRLIPIILNPDLTDPEQMSIRSDLEASLEGDDASGKKTVYDRELAAIDSILDKYRVVRHQVDYDVFISVKQMRSGRYTKDSDVASDLYDFLKKKGLKVFNSRRTPIPAGQEFEPYIISALIASRVLIVVGSSAQNMNAQWVKNEWSRFQWLQKSERKQTGKTDRKLFCYLAGNMRPSQIPKALEPDNQAIVDGVMANEQLAASLGELFIPDQGGGVILTPPGDMEIEESLDQVLAQIEVWLALGKYDNVLAKYDELMEKGLHVSEVRIHLGALCAKYQVDNLTDLAGAGADLSKEKILKAAKRVCKADGARVVIKELLDKNKAHLEPKKTETKKPNTTRVKKQKEKEDTEEVKPAETAPAEDKAAVWYQNGLDAVEQGDLSKAYQHFRNAAKEGHVQAMYRTAQMLMEGEGVRLNRPQAFKWYQTIAESGDADAWFLLAGYYKNGIGVRKDMAQSVECYHKAADLGHAEAQDIYAECLLNGRDVPKDEKTAFEYYKKAAEQGRALAQLQIGKMYAEGTGVRKNQKSAAGWFLKAAEQGNPEAQYYYGEACLTGAGTGKDPVEAISWLKKAADQNHGAACYQLSQCFKTGIGTDKDDKEAVKWLRVAANKGNGPARYELGKRYETGDGVKLSPDQAFTWVRRAVSSYPSVPEAENTLGQYYERGFGTRKDKQIARIYYEGAMKKGYTPAKANYDRLKKSFFGMLFS